MQLRAFDRRGDVCAESVQHFHVFRRERLLVLTRSEQQRRRACARAR